MKAAVIQSPYHMDLCDIPAPSLKEGEVLVQVMYTGICGSDLHIFRGEHPTAKFPLVAGHEFVGKLVKVHGESCGLKIGDMVVAQEAVSCGRCQACVSGHENVCRNLRIIGVHQDGGFAEYVKVPARKTYRIAPGTDPRIAALTEPLAVAVHDVRTGGLEVGDRALIFGGGPIGTLIAMICRLSGAGKILITEINPVRRKILEEMGFLTASPEDPSFEETVKEAGGADGFDVCFETVGKDSTMACAMENVKNAGVIVLVAMNSHKNNLDLGRVFAKEIGIKGVRLHTQKHFAKAVEIINSHVLDGDLSRLITDIYPLDEIRHAFDEAGKGDSCFKILIQVSG